MNKSLVVFSSALSTVVGQTYFGEGCNYGAYGPQQCPDPLGGDDWLCQLNQPDDGSGNGYCTKFCKFDTSKKTQEPCADSPGKSWKCTKEPNDKRTGVVDGFCAKP